MESKFLAKCVLRVQMVSSLHDLYEFALFTILLAVVIRHKPTWGIKWGVLCQIPIIYHYNTIG